MDEFVKRAKRFEIFRDNPYQIIRLDLSVARNKEHIVRAGDLVKIVHASSGLANIDIRFNNDSYPAINFARYRKVETFYKDLYVTNATQAGEWVDLLLAIKEWFDVTDFFFRLDALSAGVILMWSGLIADIPTGYVLCDGTLSTPDLRDKFVVGARQDDGGVAKTLITASLTQSGGQAYHDHEFTGTGHQHGPGNLSYIVEGADDYVWLQGDSATAAAYGTTDGSSVIPVPYYALAFIMKT